MRFRISFANIACVVRRRERVSVRVGRSEDQDRHDNSQSDRDTELPNAVAGDCNTGANAASHPRRDDSW